MSQQQQPIILRGHIDEVTSVYFEKSTSNLSSSSLFSGDLKGNFNIFNLETRRVKQSIPNHHNGCILGFYQDDHYLYSQGREGCIKRLDLNQINISSSSPSSSSLEWYYNSIFSFCKFAPCRIGSSLSFFVPCDKEQVMLLDCREKQTLDGYKSSLMIAPPVSQYSSLSAFGMLTGMVCIDHSQYLLCSYEGGVIVEFDVRKLSEPTFVLENFEKQENLEGEQPKFCNYRDLIGVRHIYDLHNAQDPIIAINYQSELDKIIIGASSTQIHVMDRANIPTNSSIDTNNNHSFTGEQTSYSFEMKSGGVNDISCYNMSGVASTSQMSRLMFAGCWDGSVRVFDLKRKKKLAVYKYHENAIRSLDFKENNKEILLAAGCKDSKISIWNVNFETKRK
ncbi:predicted protein [Naegleria gruberi]|uniref:Predicted protein n=1 Tax=Naegleria gruberi TaxID=5762 RepID=D2V0Y8_NAEGR|nr:uncharacterized protein NAEGRDRAFT_62462 [Naegleria gruberi]EFC49600.1 predicted protein [Naegleria gruberi]|eukprot:XP_002682344.1 predicted protein [Naegleria gruberi strain NEG-M]